MALRTFADISSYRPAPSASPLDALIGGFQQGIQLQQLPGKLQEVELARQIQNAINFQKLQDLQNPQAALARDIERQLTLRGALDPNLGITTGQRGLGVIATPGAITAQQQAALPAVVTSETVLPTAPASLPVTEVAPFGIPTGVYSDPGVPLAAETRKTDEFIRRLNAAPALSLTKEGYSFNRRTGQLEAPTLPDETTLPEQLLSQRQSEAAAKAQSGKDVATIRSQTSKDLAQSRTAAQKELQEDQQTFVAEQNEKNRENRLSLADKRSKLTTPGVSEYQLERQTRVLQSVEDLEKDVGYDTVGFADWFKAVPTSAAKSFASRLKTLKAAIAFGELTAMREASKTGGALGQVSNIELGLLESALGALDQAQSPSEFKEELGKVRGSINRWRDAAGKVGVPAGAPTAPPAGNAPVKVNTKAERDALAPGTVYISPSGSISTR